MKMLLLLFNVLNLFNFSSTFVDEKVLEEDTNFNNIVGISENAYILSEKENSYLYYDNESYDLNSYEISSVVDAINNIYLISNQNEDSTIISFNKFNKTIDYCVIEQGYISNIYDINNTLFLIGKIENNGLILNLDYGLEEIDRRVFFSDGSICVNHLVFDDYFYITIYKDGITNNSEFINHGNLSDIKSIIVKLDSDFAVIDCYYLDEKSNVEIVKNLYLFKDHIKLLLQTKNGYYIYNLDKELDSAKYYKVDSTDDLELLCHYKSVKEDLLFNKTTNALCLSNLDSCTVLYQLSEYKLINDYKVLNGELYLYGQSDQLLIMKLQEYEIIKQEQKILNYFNLDYLNTSNIIVESWFEELMIEVKEITPFFEKTNAGRYEITYQIQHLNGQSICLSVPLIVSEYTNFINNGVYKVGKVLEFFGTAKLDGTNIYYGTCLSEPGEYDIEITNINGDVSIYHIYIVDDYYKDEKVINLPSIDIYQNNACVNIEIGNLTIEDVIINEESYADYEIIDHTLVIYFNQIENSVCSYYLNGLNVQGEDGNEYLEINQELTFNYLKNKPLIYLNPIIEEDEFNIQIDISDIDKAFMYLKVLNNSHETIVTTNKKLTGNTFKIYLVYELGNGKINEILISEISQKTALDLNLDMNYLDGSIKEVKIKYALEKENLNTLNVNSISYLDYYKEISVPNYLVSVIIISVIIFVLIGVCFGGYIIFKKVREHSF